MMSTISTKSSGIVILLNFSMPDFTPADTIQAQPPRKSVWQASGPQGREMKPLKTDDTAPTSSTWKPAVSERHR